MKIFVRTIGLAILFFILGGCGPAPESIRIGDKDCRVGDMVTHKTNSKVLMVIIQLDNIDQGENQVWAKWFDSSTGEHCSTFNPAELLPYTPPAEQ